MRYLRGPATVMDVYLPNCHWIMSGKAEETKDPKSGDLHKMRICGEDTEKIRI